MSRANVKRTVLDRVRVTGTAEDVAPIVVGYRARGYRVVDHNPLREKGLRISETRIGVTLELEIATPRTRKAAAIVDRVGPALLRAVDEGPYGVAGRAVSAVVDTAGAIAPQALTAEDCLEAQDLLDELEHGGPR